MYVGRCCLGAFMMLGAIQHFIYTDVVAAAPQRSNEWTAVFEALAMSGIAFVLAGSLRRERSPR